MTDDKGPVNRFLDGYAEDMDRLREAAQPIKRELLAPVERLVAWLHRRMTR